MPNFCGDRITQAREFAALSKTALAERLDVSPAAVAQWENGTKTPTPENLSAVAVHLGVPIAFLLETKPSESSRRGPVTFRAWSTAQTRRINRKAERFAEMVAEIFSWLNAKVVLPPVVLPDVTASLDQPASIEQAATACRRAWGLGDRPIMKLAELLEAKGVIVAAVAFDDLRVDAFSCVINGRPFIFLGNQKQDRARSRFDAAHELGHLLLHQHHSDLDLRNPGMHAILEKEAHAFAGAFLMPEELFRQDVLHVSLDSLLRIKPKWGVSVQAMVKRCQFLGLIGEEETGDLFRQIGVRGWRRAKGEPYDELLPLTAGRLGAKSLRVLEDNKLISRWELSGQLPFPTTVLRGVFGYDPHSDDSTEMTKIIPVNFSAPPAQAPTVTAPQPDTEPPTPNTMSKNQHVVPRDGGWAVHGAGNSRDTSVHATQSAAVTAARSIAINQKTEVVVHGRDGQIREKNSYGNDPCPPRG